MTALHIRYGDTPLLPADVLLAAIPSLPRPLLARLTQRLIDRLDELDGDPEVEMNGDELDGTLGEDEFIAFPHNVGPWDGPGCAISDPPEDGDSDRCLAGDDWICGGSVPDPMAMLTQPAPGIGSDDDGEFPHQPAIMLVNGGSA